MIRSCRRTGFITSIALSIAAALGSTSLPAAAQPAPGDDVSPADRLQEQIRTRIEAASGEPGRLTVGDDVVQAREALGAFYERRTYRPAWLTPAGRGEAVASLIAALESAPDDGLDPDDYHLPEIRRLVREVKSALRGTAGTATGDGQRRFRLRLPGRRERAEEDGSAVTSAVDVGRLADLEVLLTDAFLLYGSHLLTGRVDPETLHGNWVAQRREADLAAVLEDAVAGGDARASLARLRPPQPGYDRLRDALARYRSLAAAGGWPTVPDGPALRPGDRSERVPALRARLEAADEATAGGAGTAVPLPDDSLLYEEALAGAVRAFQARHGLEPDAVVGTGTLSALNVPADERVRQIEVNLERWRWLPQDLGERYVLVNAADFELEVVEHGETVLSMRAIVGRPYRQTPVFSDRLSYLVFSPYWHVPHTLAVQDQLPLQKQDPTYFSRVGMRVFRGWGADAEAVDPAAVDWSRVAAGSFPFRLRQDPGPQNALGGVKFMFPNRFNVYLHDTPSRDLFARQTRNFSSGCIRLEAADELAAYLLREDPRWTPERIRQAARRGEETTVRLPSDIPVHLLYWTAWAEGNGTVKFRSDVYGRDAPVARALDRPAPTSPGPDALPSIGDRSVPAGTSGRTAGRAGAAGETP